MIAREFVFARRANVFFRANILFRASLFSRATRELFFRANCFVRANVFLLFSRGLFSCEKRVSGETGIPNGSARRWPPSPAKAQPQQAFEGKLLPCLLQAL